MLAGQGPHGPDLSLMRRELCTLSLRVSTYPALLPGLVLLAVFFVRYYACWKLLLEMNVITRAQISRQRLLAEREAFSTRR